MLMLMLILMLMLMLIFTLRLKILSAETAMPKADKRTRWSLWKVIDIFDKNNNRENDNFDENRYLFNQLPASKLQF